MKTTSLINDLRQRTRSHLEQAQSLNTLSLAALNWRPAPKQWSILECLEHLNLYGDFYLPEIDRRMAQSNNAPSPEFTSGWLGDYFAKAMLPRQPLNKMQTFASKNPLGSALNKTTIDRFINQQQQMLNLLERSANVSLNRTKTSITIRFLKIKLGDTFRVVIYHNERHMVQIRRIMAAQDLPAFTSDGPSSGYQDSNLGPSRFHRDAEDIVFKTGRNNVLEL